MEIYTHGAITKAFTKCSLDQKNLERKMGQGQKKVLSRVVRTENGSERKMGQGQKKGVRSINHIFNS
jgi:hypothetical protein